MVKLLIEKELKRKSDELRKKRDWVTKECDKEKEIQLWQDSDKERKL